MKKRCLGGRAETLGLLGYILVHKKDFGRGDEGIRNWIRGNAFLDQCSGELKGQLWSWKKGNKKRMLKAESDLRERPLISSWANEVLHLVWQLLSSCLPAPNTPHALCCVRLNWPHQPHLCSARCSLEGD